jgi:hypothetical protein
MLGHGGTLAYPLFGHRAAAAVLLEQGHLACRHDRSWCWLMMLSLFLLDAQLLPGDLDGQVPWLIEMQCALWML